MGFRCQMTVSCFVCTSSHEPMYIYILRDMLFAQHRKVNSIERAHVRGVDYNPKREHILVRSSFLSSKVLPSH